MADRPPGRLARLVQLGTMTGKVAGSYVREQVKAAISGSEMGRAAMDRLHIDNARDVAEVMSQLKGAAMKLGQQLSAFADTLDLPPEVAQSLKKLQSKAEPVPFPRIREDIEASLGRPIDHIFPWIDPHPLGTASLAQAHAARLPDGREVVVKVLHRDVERSVSTDMMALKALMMSQRAAMGRSREEMSDIFDEISDRLKEELDYLQEAANLATYHRWYGADPRLSVPSVHVELSTDRVLVMDRISGVDLDTFISTASPEAQQRAGLTLAEFYYEQVFLHRTLHADPHPGNYLFQPDGRVGVLDFGCVKRFDRFWLGTYASVALAMVDGDRKKALERCVELGSWDGKDPRSGDVLWRFILGIGAGFRGGEVTLGAEDERYMEDMKPIVMELIRHPEIRAPKDVIMLHRSLGGLYAMNRKLKLRADYGALLRKHAEHAVREAYG